MAVREKLLGPGLAALLGLCLSAGPQAALAQGGLSEAPQAGAVQEVVVTARRREERLQDVPLAISAFSSAALAQRGAASMSDIASLTPGLNFESYANAGYPVLTIRGLSQTNILAFEGNVSTFYGGVYLPRNYMVDTGLVGLERVEVVKGPQSALYGRNAFAGAINYVLQEPKAKPHLEGQVTGGTYGRFDYGLTTGRGFLDDKVKVLVGGQHSEFGGTWINNRPGVNSGVSNGTNDRMGGWDNNTYFGYVTLEPTSRLHVTLNYVRSEKDTEAQGRFNISRNTGDTNCSTIGGVKQFYCGEIPVRPANLDPRSQGLHATNDFYRVAANYDLTSELTAHYMYGKVDTAAYSFDQTSINSVTGDVAAGVQFLGLPVGSNQSTSHEAHLDWNRGGTKASGGVFYSLLNDNYITELIFQAPNSLVPITPASTPRTIAQNVVTKVRTQSVFGQVSQDLMDGRFNLSVEGRYTEEVKDLSDLVARANFSAKFKAFAPRAVLKWNISPLNNLYVSAAKGVKSGGFNSGAILANERLFDPETNWTYELGSKNEFFERRLQLNASAFYTDWQNLQTNSQSGNAAFLGTITRNVGTAKVYGVELEARGRIVSGLNGGVSFAYTHPTYGDNIIDPRFLVQNTALGVRQATVCDGVVCPANGSIGGNILPRQSQYQGSVNLRYDGQFPAGHDFWVGGDLAYKSKQYVDPLTLTYVPSRVLVNLNAGVAMGPVNIEAFIHNALNEKYVSSVTYNLGSNIRYEATLGELRTGGVTVRYRY